MGYIFCYAEPEVQEMLLWQGLKRGKEQLSDLLELDLLIIQDTFIIGGKRRLGTRFLVELRKQYNCDCPIIITYWHTLPTLKLTYADIEQDPYVYCVPLDILLEEIKAGSLTKYLYTPEQKRDTPLLYEDLRKTLYDANAFLNNIEHELNNALNIVPLEEIGKAQQLIQKYWQRAVPMLQSQYPTILTSSALQAALQELKLATTVNMLHDAKSNMFRVTYSFLANHRKQDFYNEELVFRLLYFSQNHSAHELISAQFLEKDWYFQLRCIGVSTLEDAENTLANDPNCLGLITDYRFRIDNRIAPRNGAHIIRDMHSIFPNAYYAYITSIPIGNTVQPPIGKNVPVFDKEQIMKGRETELHRLFVDIDEYRMKKS